MGNQYKKYKNFLEKFLDSSRGKRFFNIVYSVGAAIVIIGAMAKILHWPFGNEMLMIGMITEALVFLLSAFEKPDKEYKWEEVYPVLADNDDFVPKAERVNQTQQTEFVAGSAPAVQSTSIPNSTARNSGSSSSSAETSQNQQLVTNRNTSGSGVIGGGNYSGSSSSSNNKETVSSNTTNTNPNPIAGNITIVGGGYSGGTNTEGLSDSVTNGGAEQLSKIADNMDKFAKATDALTQISESLQKSFSTITENADGIGNNTQNYITQLESLNRNIAGLNTIYEIQLKGVSGQINTIEHINAGLDRMKKLYDGSLADSSIFKNETEKMAQQLSELNRVYSRLLQAMTSNMNMGGGFNNMGNNNTPTQP